MTESLQARFYVATTGSDAWSGRHAQPISGSTDGPFATLARARDAVRELTARIRSGSAMPEGEIRVEVRAGRYYLREPLLLGPADSGSSGCPVTYAAYPDEEPILSGGVRLTAWQPFAGEILRCELPAGARGELARFRQLVLDGKRQRRARWPKFEPDNPIHGGWAFVERPAGEDSHNAFVYRPGTFRGRWGNPRQVEVNIYPYKGWCNCIVPLASIDEESRTIRLAHDVWDVRTRAPWYWSMPLSPGNRFFVENALEELDRPGEWCLDLDRRHVYFWPPAPLTPDSEVVLPVLDGLIDLQNASHINLSGLTLTETTSGDNMHRTGLDGYGAQLPTPGWTYAGEAIHLRDTHHVTIEGNRIRTVGGNAVYLEGYNSRNEIRGNEVDGCGANGIALIGTTDRHPVDNRVADNDIHHCGAINKFVAGVFLGLSDGTTVQHNAIHDVPHHAINLGSNGYGRNVLEYNDIRRACLEIFDTGAINSWADTLDVTRTYVARNVERSGHVIRHNFIGQTWGLAQDERGNLSAGSVTKTRGVYLDDYTSNCFVYGNIVVGAVIGIQINGGKNNVVENNLLIDCTSCGLRVIDGCAYYPAAQEMRNFTRGNRFRGNIVFSASEASLFLVLGVRADDPITDSDQNLYCVSGGRWAIHDELADGRTAPKHLSLAEWQQRGFDRHSVTGDPLFADPQRGDYSLLPDSPAHALGIVGIDQARIGPRSSRAP